MTLSHRAETAKPEEARGLLEELFRVVHGRSPAGVMYDCGTFGTRPGHDDRKLAETFRSIIDIDTPEAHLAAAMMLVPGGLVWNVQTDFGLPGRARLWGSVLPGQVQDRGWTADGATPALALIAAIARSQGQ